MTCPRSLQRRGSVPGANRSRVRQWQHQSPLLHRAPSCDVVLSHSPYFCTVQGHASNQCFHHSFLEASSFFTILPLVILSSWKRLLSHCYPGAVILEAEGRDPQILDRWVEGRVAGGSLESWTGREILVYLIMYREVCSKVVTFEEK